MRKHYETLVRRGAVLLAMACVPPHQLLAGAPAIPAPTPPADVCLADGAGFFRARLSGAMELDIDWPNQGTDCSGAVRPDGGIRLGFSRRMDASGDRLVILFGIPGLKEGQSARALPVNVTVIRQGTAQFFSTQGPDRCTLDEVRQEPIAGIPRRARTYRIAVRGFCSEPARAVQGSGAVLLSRFDYVGRVDYALLDEQPEGDL